MSSSDFVHLHCHSEYSLLDGMCRIKDLFSTAQEYSMPAVAITDHGNLFGAIEFYMAADEYGVKPIIGSELYISATDRHERKGRENQSPNHIVLLAKSYEGYLNLAKLSTIGYLEGFYYKPRIDKEVLAKYSKDLVCMTACIKGQVPRFFVDRKPNKAREALGDYLDIFGKENLFLELQDHGLSEQRIANEGMIELAKEFDLKLVATNDCHYMRQSDSRFHDVLLCVQTGSTLKDQDRFSFTGDQFYFRSPDEMKQLFAEVPEAITNTLLVAEMINPEIKLKQSLLPEFHPPDGSTNAEFLTKLTQQGLRERYGENYGDDVRERAEYELSIINKMELSAYLLIVWDFVRFAKQNGIPVGPGRGSAAGSIVVYALGITTLDPLEHGLLFERFLNPERISMPDIDIDFCYEKREQVIDYVRKKYGKEQVAQIITFGTMKARNAVRDVGRVMDIPLNIVDRVAKLIPSTSNLKQAVEKVHELRQMMEEEPSIKECIESAMALEGLARHSGKHAAGVVIASQPLDTLIPLAKASQSGEILTQYSMDYVTEIGLLKMDFLGLKTLTLIEEAIENIKRTKGVKIDWEEIPLDDAETYALLQTGETDGLFQLESRGMRDMVKRLRPDEFGDIVALNALYRPGPLESGMVDKYIDTKMGRIPVEYYHPLLEPVLKETYGTIIYQEQVQKIANVLAKFSLGEADILRKAVAKKKEKLMAEQKVKFIDGAVANNIDAALADRIFKLIEKFAGYGFPKAHSAAYAMLSYRTAYLKTHYPVEFMAALMTIEMGKALTDSKIPQYIETCKDKGIEILPPDVNESFSGFTVVGENIRFGLAAIKNVGKKAIEVIIEERSKKGKYTDLLDFCNRQSSTKVSARVIECLTKAGAFDSINPHRAQLLAALPSAIDLAASFQKDKSTGQTSLFEAMNDSSTPSIQTQFSLPNVPQLDEKTKLEFEKEYLGLFITGQPLDKYRIDIKSFSSTSARAISQMEEGGGDVSLVGMIKGIRRTTDKNGNDMAFFTFEDLEGAIDCVVFKGTFSKCRSMIEEENVIWMSAQVNSRNGSKSLQVKEIMSVEDMRNKSARFIDVEIPESAVDAQLLNALKSLPRNFKGRSKLRLCVEIDKIGTVQITSPKALSLSPTDECVAELKSILKTAKITFARE